MIYPSPSNEYAAIATTGVAAPSIDDTCQVSGADDRSLSASLRIFLRVALSASPCEP